MAIKWICSLGKHTQDILLTVVVLIVKIMTQMVTISQIFRTIVRLLLNYSIFLLVICTFCLHTTYTDSDIAEKYATPLPPPPPPPPQGNSSVTMAQYGQFGHPCECFIVLKKWPILWVHWRSNFKNKHCLSRENQSWSLCKSGQIFIRFTNID
jgi:uncharacterized membrane protein